MTSIRTSLARFRLLDVRDSILHWPRTLLLVMIVAVSTSLLVAVLTTYGSVTTSVAKLSSALAGNAAFVVHGITDFGVDTSFKAKLETIPGVQAAIPIVQKQIDIQTGGTSKSALLLGADTSVVGLKSELSSSMLPSILQNSVIFGQPNTVVVGSETGLAANQTASIAGQQVRVGAVVHAANLNAGNFVLAPLPLAQSLSLGSGLVTAIYIVATDTAAAGEIEKGLIHTIGSDAVVTSPDYQAKQAAQSTSLISNSALMVSLIAFVIAAFLMFNTMHMSVAQRRKSLTILRALGAKPSLLFGHLLAESALLGLLGGTIGIGIGIVVGRVAIDHLPAFAMQSVSAQIVYSVPAYVPALALGTTLVTCMVAAAGAGMQVFKVSPVEAFGGVALETAPSSALTRMAGFGGTALLVLTAALVIYAKGQAGLIAAATLLLAILAILFAFTRGLVRIAASISRRFGSVGLLSAATLTRLPRRTWASIATIAVTISVAVGVSGALTGMAHAATNSISSLGRTDLYVTRTPSDVLPTGDLLDPSITDTVGDAPNVSAIVPGQWIYADVDGRQVTIQGLASGSNAVTLAAMDANVRGKVLAGDGIVVSDQLARANGYQQGSLVELATPSGPHKVEVLQIVQAASVAGGVIGMELTQLQDWYKRPGATYLEVAVQDHNDTAAVLRHLTDTLPAGTYVYTGEEALRSTSAAVGQAGIIAIALEWMIAAFAAVGLLNTFTISVLERRQELGVLRAIGARRDQTTSMILVEAGAVGIVGGLVGFATGIALHYLGCEILSASTGLPVEFSLQVSAVGFATAAVVICLFGALMPSIRAGRLTVVDALASR